MCDARDKTNGQIAEMTALLRALTNGAEERAYVCDCGAEFRHQPSLSRHKRTCGAGDGKTEANNGNQQGLQRQLEELKRELRAVQEVMKRQNTGQTVTNTITNSNVLQQNIHITTQKTEAETEEIIATMRSFGEENLDHITDTFKKECILNRDTGIYNLIERIHYDPEVLENMNVRPKSIKRKTMEVFNKELGWVEQSKNHVLSSLIGKANRMLGAYFAANLISDEDFKINQELIARFQNDVYNGITGRYPPTFYWTMMGRIECMIQNAHKLALKNA